MKEDKRRQNKITPAAKTWVCDAPEGKEVAGRRTRREAGRQAEREEGRVGGRRRRDREGGGWSVKGTKLPNHSELRINWFGDFPKRYSRVHSFEQGQLRAP